jgi:hypothetical protein
MRDDSTSSLRYCKKMLQSPSVTGFMWEIVTKLKKYPGRLSHMHSSNPPPPQRGMNECKKILQRLKAMKTTSNHSYIK